LVFNGSPWDFLYFSGGVQKGQQHLNASQVIGGTVSLGTFTLAAP